MGQLGEEDKGKVRVQYLGGDERKFIKLAQQLAPGLETKVMGYLPVGHLAVHCQKAAVNAYIGYRSAFHHKLLELLACDRPVMVCPAESDESKRLARAAGAVLLEVQDARAVLLALKKIFSIRQSNRNKDRSKRSLRGYGWPEQAAALERVLDSVLSNQRSAAKGAK